jgi:predicted alpha/beta-hydrolase family hydrolase
VPTLVIQGQRDAFGGADAFPATVDVVEVPEADHSFKVLKSAVLSPEDVLALIVETAVEWVTTRVA